MPKTYLGHTTTEGNADLDPLWVIAENAAGNATTALADAAAALVAATAALDSQPTGGGRVTPDLPTYLSNNKIFNVVDFGMVGDGVTDDFPAWKLLVAAVNAAGGGRVEFLANKTYFFGQHIVAGNGVTNPIFQSCTGVEVVGNGSSIKVQGNFNRAVTSTATVSGLIFYDCTNIQVRNLDINGNNTTITKSGGVTEAFAYGLYFGSCNQVLIENVRTHHWITDGVAFNVSNVTNPCLACREITMVNVVSQYNARQGMSIIQIFGGTFINCDFSFTGQSSYGNHSPSAGVDIEQDRFTDTAVPQQMDVNTGQLVFSVCRFYFNLGECCVSSFPAYTMGIVYDRCDFDVGVGNTPNSFGVINDARDVTFRDCTFDMQDRGFYGTFTFNAAATGYVNVHGCTVRSQTECIRMLHSVPSIVADNRFLSTKTSPSQTANVVYLQNDQMTFARNYTFIPKAGYVNEGAGDRCGRLSTLVRLASENRYETDLPANQSGATTAHYANAYTSETADVRNERYLGTAVGTADTIRPSTNRNSDTTFPFSFGTGHSGGYARFGLQEQARQFGCADAMPTTGTWLKGDRIFNNNPAEAGAALSKYIITGWIRLTTGSNNVLNTDWFQMRTLTGN